MSDKFEITIELENVKVVEFFMKPTWNRYRYYIADVCIPPPIRTKIEIHPNDPWFDQVDAMAAKIGIVTGVCKYVR